MADSTAPQTGTAPVTDRRPVPRGVLPRRMQTWVMAAIGAGMVLIMFVAGRSTPPPPVATAAASQPVAPSADRLRDYQDRLRVMEHRAAEQSRAAAAPSMPGPPPSAMQESAPAASPDPLVEERKRREYESLFASNVIASRRPADQQPVGNGDAGASPLPFGRSGGSAVTSAPNLDDVANAVVRATARYTPSTAGASTTAQTTATHAGGSASTSTAANVRSRTGPIDDSGPMHRLLEGTVIDTVLTNRLDGSIASPVDCLVTTPVYSHDGQHVLIPAGSRVLGNTKPVQAVGESRLAVAFHRLVFPNGATVSLDQFTGLNQAGDAALRDQVNHHYWSTFGAAAAVGVISGLGQYIGTAGVGQGSGDRTVVIAGGLGNATTEATAQTMNQFLNRFPTVTIREGHRVKVYLTSDLELPAYDDEIAPRPDR